METKTPEWVQQMPEWVSHPVTRQFRRELADQCKIATQAIQEHTPHTEFDAIYNLVLFQGQMNALSFIERWIEFAAEGNYEK